MFLLKLEKAEERSFILLLELLKKLSCFYFLSFGCHVTSCTIRDSSLKMSLMRDPVPAISSYATLSSLESKESADEERSNACLPLAG